MALSKKITLENGVEVNYHRIVSITEIINEQTIIELASYTSEEKRNEEKNALETGNKTGEAVPMNVFIDTKYINKDYSEKDTINNCYEYLKTTDEFKNSKDI
jgi:hypothetical protein